MSAWFATEILQYPGFGFLVSTFDVISSRPHPSAVQSRLTITHSIIWIFGYMESYPVYTSLHSPTHITCHTFEHWFRNFGTICTEDDGDQHRYLHSELNTKVTSTSDPEEILFLKRLKVCLGLIANCN